MRSSLAGFVSAILLTLAATASAQINGTWTGADGATWNTTDTNWTGVTVSSTPWAFPGTTANATFNATSGSASVSDTVFANTITYSPVGGNFLIANGNITLAGNATINNYDPSGTLTLSSTVAGSAGLISRGAGTLVIAGNNTYTGNTTIRGGPLVLDYSGRSNTADPLSTGNVTLDMGTLVLRGKSSGSTSETISTLNMGANLGTANTLRLDSNGGSGITLNASTFVMNTTAANVQNINLIDLSSSASNSITVGALGSGTGVANGVLMGNSNRANLVVRDSTGYGFATLSGASNGTIGRLSTGTTLTASNTSNTTNYFLNTAGTLTRSAALAFHTLTIDSTNGAVTLAMGANNIDTGGNGRGILVTGASDVAITGSGLVNQGLWIHNYGSGTFTIGLGMAGNGTAASWMVGGTGLTVWSAAAATPKTTNDNLYIEGGIFRPTADQNWTSGTGISAGGIFVSSGGVLEVGADLNGANAGDLSNTVGTGTGHIRFWGSSGVSAFGANRTVNFGNGTSQSLNWGSSNFLTDAGGTGDGNYVFKLSSNKSDSTVTVQNAIALGSLNRTVEVADGSAATDAILGGVLSGTGGLVKSGAGALTLSGNNTYTGNTIISAGNLEIGSTGRLGGGSYAGNIANNGTLTYNGTNSQTLSGIISGSGALIKNGAATLTLSGANTFTGATSINAGTLQIGAGSNTGSLSSSSAVTNNGTLEINRIDATTFSNTISGSGGLLKSGAGDLTLSGNNSYTGGTTITGANNLIMGANNALGNGALTFNTTATARLNLNGTNQTVTSLSILSNSSVVTVIQNEGSANALGTITFNIADGVTSSSNSNFYFRDKSSLNGTLAMVKTGNGTLDFSTYNTMSYSGGLTVNGGNFSYNATAALGTGAITLGGGTLNYSGASGSSVTISNTNISLTAGTTSILNNANGTVTVSGTIGGTGNLTKSGAGTLTLSGSSANTYNGTTTVSVGTLTLNKDTNVVAVGGDLVLNSSSKLLYGASKNEQIANAASITINGSQSVFNGSGWNGTTGANGITETISSLTVRDGQFNTGTGGNWTVTGAGVFDGSSGDVRFLGFSSSSISFGSLSLTAMTGTTIISSADSFVMGGSNAAVTTLSLGSGGLTLNGSTLVLAKGTAAGNAGSRFILDGNITTTGSSASFIASDSGTIGISDILLSSMAGSVTRTITTGSGANLTISVPITNGNATTGGIIKDGPGTLTLSGSNTFTGATTINAGTLSIAAITNGGVAGALGNSTNAAGNLVFGGGTLEYTGTASGTTNRDFTLTAGTTSGISVANSTVSLTISGNAAATTGALTKLGNGTLILSGNNSYTGATRVDAGTLTVSTSTAVAGTSGITVSNGVRLLASVNAALQGKAVTLTGNGTGTGALIFNEGASNTSNATFTLAGNAAIRNGQFTDLQLANAIGESSAGSVLTLTGGSKPNANFNGSSIRLDGNNTFSGGLVIDSVKVLPNNSGWAGAGNGLAGVTLQNGGGIDLTWANRSIAGNLTMTDGFIYSSANARTISAANFLMINGTVGTNATLTGSGSLIKSGAGTVTLSGNNTYTGATTINGGTLSIAAITNGGVAGALGNSTNAAGNLVLGGATLEYTGTVNGTTDRNFTLTAGTTSGISVANSTVSLTISGAAAATNGGLAKSGSGSLVLSGANAYTGDTTISAGTLEIASTGRLGGGTYSGNITNNGAFTFNSSSSQTLSGIISGTGNLTKSGAGTLTLSNANTYQGITTINAGAINLTGSNTASATTINSGGTLIGTGTAGAVTVNTGGFIGAGNAAATPGTLTVGALTLNGGGGYTWDLSNTSGTPGTNWDLITATSTTIGATSGDKFTIFLTGNPTNWSPASTYSAGWNILQWGTLNSVFDANAFTVNTNNFTGVTPTGTWAFSSTGGFLNLSYTAPSSSGIWTAAGGNWSTAGNWQGSVVPANNSPLEFNGSSGVSTNDSALTSIAGITFNSGAGSYTLDGTALNITGGITNNSSSAQTVAIALTMGGAQTFNAGAANLTISGSLANAGNTLTASGSNTVAISGNISGAGGLTKNGAGSLVLSGASTYTGATLISDGNLVLDGSLIGTDITVSAANFTQTGTGTISGAGKTFVVNSGNVTLAGSNTYTGATTINAGNFSITGSGSLGSGGIYAANISNNGTFTLNTTVAQTLSGVVSGSGALVKANTNTLTLSGSNTYTGATTINAGTLQIGNGSTTGSISSSSAISNNGTMAINRSDAITISNTISGTGNLTQVGTGTLTLSGANTYTGATTVNAGLLTLSNSTSVAGTSGITVSNGARLQANVNAALQGKAVTITGNGTGTGAVIFSENVNYTSNATFTLAGNAAIRNGQFTNLQLANAIGESSAGSVLTLTGNNKPDANFAGSAIYLNGNNTFSGGLVIDSVKVLPNNSGWAGAGNGAAGVTLQNGGGIDLTLGSRTIAGNLTMTDGFIYSSANARTISAANFLMINGTVGTNATLTGSGSLIKSGAGTVTLTGNNINQAN